MTIQNKISKHRVALWGGAECTVNRIDARFQDQSRISGHWHRPEDLERFAELGFSALRYPLLWEHVAPQDPARRDWSWADERFPRIRELGMRPIAGLVHHGSGPAYTNLLDPDFATGLAEHARAAAERYPWIADWTPVNEPLTTARFSALYGHWYPHAQDERSFWLALLNQIDAVRFSMAAIREVNPSARLIQTEDLGRSWATVPLRHQAAFDNVRRWMTWDLLAGRVLPEHPFWNRLVSMGLRDRLHAMAESPCPADVIGINHYLTSDRFLDHRLRRYPADKLGGNRQQRFADVEAVRVLEPAPGGLSSALREAWERYRTPIAITEAHNGCTREEQMRWLDDAWHGALAITEEGVQVEAVTSWALLGSQGWNTLLTSEGRYESGAFDISGGEPRPTALAKMLAGLQDGQPAHPAIGGSGWWNRPIRLLHDRVPRPATMRERRPLADVAGRPTTAPLLICGASGTLGRALARACEHRNIRHILSSRADLDLDSETSIAAAIERHRPWAVINATGWVRVDEAEHQEAACFRANAEGAARLVQLCGEFGIQTVTFSSDLVFDGSKPDRYVEADAPHPLNAYGRSKAAAEEAIATVSGTHLVVRTAAFFSPHDPHNFAIHAYRSLLAEQRFAASPDHVVSPTYVPHLCDAVLDLAIDGAAGIWHLAGDRPLSWFEFAREIARAAGLNESLIVPSSPDQLGWIAPRPERVVLASRRGALMPPLENAIRDFVGIMDRARSGEHPSCRGREAAGNMAA